MSRRDLQAVRSWTTEHVQNVLARHGLGECCNTVGKRAVDGDMLLTLTEGRLALWKCDLNLATIKKLSRFIQDVKDHPEKYIYTDSVPSVPVSHNIVQGLHSVSHNSAPDSRAVSHNSAPDPCAVSHNSAPDPRAVSHNSAPDPRAVSHNSAPDPRAVSHNSAPDPRAVSHNSAPDPRAVSHNSAPNPRAVSHNSAPNPRAVHHNSTSNHRAVSHSSTPNSHAVSHNTSELPAMTLDSSSVVRQSSPHATSHSSLSDAWDTDFSSDEDSNKLPNGKSSAPEDEVEYSNQMPPQEDKPLPPARPPVLAPKPVLPPSNLPKPPVLQESRDVKTIVDNLKLLDNQFDEEEYESLDGETIGALKQTFETSSRLVPDTPQNQQTVSVAEIPKHSTDVAKKEGSTDEYVSDEYESIKANEKPVNVAPAEGTEYYLQPVHQQSADQTRGAPALPAKPWRKPPDATLPISKPPSPPQRKSDDGSLSPGNSGDGVVGLLGEILRKIRGPDTRVAGPLAHNLLHRLCMEMADVAVGMKRRLLYPLRRLLSRYDDVLPPDEQQERTPIPEVKKAATLPSPSHKTFQTNQRPLPPTPDGSTGSRRGSRLGLTQQPWYHNVDRRRAEEMLRNGEDGCFVVRPSSQTNNLLTLTLWYNKRLYNIGIRHRPDGRYALGTEKTNEQSFVSVEELVQNYQSEKLVLYTGGERTGRTLLTSSPAQSYQPDTLPV